MQALSHTNTHTHTQQRQALCKPIAKDLYKSGPSAVFVELFRYNHYCTSISIGFSQTITPFYPTHCIDKQTVFEQKFRVHKFNYLMKTITADLVEHNSLGIRACLGAIENDNFNGIDS